MQRLNHIIHIIPGRGAMRVLVLTAVMAVTSLAGCRPDGTGSDNAGRVQGDDETQFHADADIAMTVRSIADALRVGEQLDSADYDYRGILTDGMGRPIYTDLYGNPGEWVVDVLTPGSAVLRNLNPGDLLPDDLQEYLLGNLGVGAENEIVSEEYADDDQTDVAVYDFGGGEIRFETRTSPSPNGTDATFMSIVLIKNAT